MGEKDIQINISFPPTLFLLKTQIYVPFGHHEKLIKFLGF